MLKVDEFFNVYIATIHELYTESFIKQNHLEPSNITSFKKAMSRKAGVSLGSRTDDSSYTKKDLQNIVKDTNSKYEEYATGDYTQELRRKGEGRYMLFSNLFSAVLKKLGLSDIAEGLKYTDEKVAASKSETQKTDAEVLKDTLAEAKATAEPEKNEENKELDSKIELLEACEKKVGEIDKNTEEKIISEVLNKLNSTIESAKKYNKTANNSRLSKLIEKCIAQSERLKSLIPGNDTASDADIQRLKDHFEGKDEEETTMKKENPFEKKKSDVDIESLIPEVLEAIPKFLKQGHEAAKENKELQEKIKKLKDENSDLIAKLEEAKQATTLPTDEDELVKLAKEVVNKIDDKGKLKDIGMVIMMKAL